MRAIDDSRSGLVVALAGDACTGKTTLAHALQLEMGDVTMVSLDGYHTETRAQRLRSRRPAVDPGANDLARARGHLQALVSGRGVDVPTYDHTRGDFGPSRSVAPAPVIFWEGLHALYPCFLDLIDLRVFFEVESRLKNRWRMGRDTGERGYSTEVLEDWLRYRVRAAERWISPQREVADLIVRYDESSPRELHLRIRAGASLDSARIGNARAVLERFPADAGAASLPLDARIASGDLRSAALEVAGGARAWACDLMSRAHEGVR